MTARKLHPSQDLPNPSAFSPQELLLPSLQPNTRPSVTVPFARLSSLQGTRQLLTGLRFAFEEGCEVRWLGVSCVCLCETVPFARQMLRAAFCV